MIVQDDDHIFTIIIMVINFQGETSLTSSLPLTSPSDVLPNTPTINRCAWNIFNINTQWTFWWVASTWPSEGWPTRWTGLKTWAAPPFNSASTSTYRWTGVSSNKQHEIIINDPKLENGQPSRVRVPQGELMLLYLPQVVKLWFPKSSTSAWLSLSPNPISDPEPKRRRSCGAQPQPPAENPCWDKSTNQHGQHLDYIEHTHQILAETSQPTSMVNILL